MNTSNVGPILVMTHAMNTPAALARPHLLTEFIMANVAMGAQEMSHAIMRYADMAASRRMSVLRDIRLAPLLCASVYCCDGGGGGSGSGCARSSLARKPTTRLHARPASELRNESRVCLSAAPIERLPWLVRDSGRCRCEPACGCDLRADCLCDSVATDTLLGVERPSVACVTIIDTPAPVMLCVLPLHTALHDAAETRDARRRSWLARRLFSDLILSESLRRLRALLNARLDIARDSVVALLHSTFDESCVVQVFILLTESRIDSPSLDAVMRFRFAEDLWNTLIMSAYDTTIVTAGKIQNTIHKKAT